MYAIEYFVGRKYGGWKRSEARFDTAERAARTMSKDAAAENDNGYSVIMRRCVKVA